MKLAGIAIVFLVLGYGLSMLITPAELGLSSAEPETGAELTIDPTEASALNQIIASDGLPIPSDSLGVSAASTSIESASGPNPPNNETSSVPEGYLTEADFLLKPGEQRPFGFRVGFAASRSEIEQVKAKLPPNLETHLARFFKANGQTSVVLLAGVYLDRDTAILAQRQYQPLLDVFLQVVSLPLCIVEGSEDEEGLLCGVQADPAAVENAKQ
ncbi:hypothetical protein N8291_09515 [Pseudomonadales bacterium]|jgi:hypothetical protein|nr:hypothetical protein [Pseudomonadales bacterium]